MRYESTCLIDEAVSQLRWKSEQKSRANLGIESNLCVFFWCQGHFCNELELNHLQES